MIKTKYVVILIVAIFVCGFLVGKSIPYFKSSLDTLIVKSTNSDDKNVNYENNVNSLIHIKNQTDVINKRASLIEYIWKDLGFPSSMPSSVETNVHDSNFSNMNNLKQIDKITINMEHDVNSIAYLFHSEKSNNKLVIYHQGHDGGFIEGKQTIEFFLKNNYSVLAFSMPLLGMNNQPLIELENEGTIKLVSHNQFFYLDSNKFTSIKYFVEPIVVSLNYINKNYDFDSYYMVGISGGGWTSTIYSAIDPRITQSYSIAGSLPINLRSSPEDLGDYEQINPSLYRIANYLDLYILDSYGENRKHVQIFNKYDPCCFSGDSFKNYENQIEITVSQLGKGTFQIYLDDTHHEHKISENALGIIIKEMEK